MKARVSSKSALLDRTKAAPASPDWTQAAPIESFVEDATAALGDDLIGLYLYGSMVSGGFDQAASDLDFVAVTMREAADLDLPALDRVHRDFVRHNPGWDDRLEVVYIGRETLRTFRTSDIDLAVISPGEPFHLGGPVRDWLQNWYLVRETGITLAGEEATAVFPVIAEAEFLAAIVRYAEWVSGRNLATLSPGALAYTVLALCRALRTVQTGAPCSKQSGARWVQQRHPDWGSLIDAALRCRLSRGAVGLADTQTRGVAAVLIRSLALEISYTARA